MYWVFISFALFALLYYYFWKPSSYWSEKGVPQRSSFGLLVNTVRSILQLDAPAESVKQFYDEFPDKRYVGWFRPVMLLRDPELIKQITVKDFEYFTDHNQNLPEHIDPLWGKALVSLTGDRWRDMRATLSPSFTSSKIKAMFVLMNESAQQFINYFKTHQDEQVVEMKDALTRFATDVIATTAFGITCDSLTNRNDEFYLMGKEATNFRGFWRNFGFLIMAISPSLARFFGIRMFSKRVTKFFRKLVKENLELREKSGIVRPDMIHLLMEARKGLLKHEDQTEVVDNGFAVIEESSIGKEEKHQKQMLTDDDITAQALIFFFAGFESVSSLMCFAVYELGVNPDIQDALRNEVDETLENCGDPVTYDALLKMKYMDMVVSETLRKWPTPVLSDRLCVKPYTIQPVREGEKPIHIEKDEVLWIPLYGIHRDPAFYPIPDRFDPERFNDENKGKLNPYAFLPFGIGPRSCIGTRFALLEIKTILFHILANFEIHVTEKTSIPLKLAKDQFTLTSDNGFWFRLKPRDIQRA